MRHRRLKLSAVLLLGLGLTGLQAQTNVNATGGNASGSEGSVSYSVGQVVYTTHKGSNGSVAHGVQQPYEISVVTGLEEAKDISLKVTAYPNPTPDYLTLEIDASTSLSIQSISYQKDASTLLSIQSMSYQLFDMQGKVLRNQKITGYRTSIDMNNLVPAAYFVTVIQENKAIKTFKIIKN